MRLLLTLAYDGRPFDGWQSQPGGNTVQDLLENAASAIAKQPLRVHGSGRTDAGVHALAQTAHFDPPEGLTMGPDNWLAALNTKLPRTIRVMAAREVDAGFHARFSACGKTYHYELSTSPVLTPFRHGLAWHLPRGLDAGLLAAALDAYRGRHDFEAFCARRGNETEATDHHRTLTRAEVSPSGGGLRLTFTGDGFLYKMVRLLVGTAVQVATDRMPLGEIAALLDQPAGLPHGRSSHCAPADGLFLEAVHYDSPS
ncbi:tRNA pseudouridine(38-40) synthase TruA [Haloferula sargassicola]|uniref:tRNA pseudouridine(38-40) synthase TruA n=1 Tax=Haloferula sargassicola TaxID=490096 RepID=UPI0033656740